MADETAAQRFARDWTSIGDDRKTRGLDGQSDERQSRLYVNSADGTSATGKSYDASKDTDGDGTVEAPTSATASTGAFAPVTADVPKNLATLVAQNPTAIPATAWTVGQKVTLADGSLAHWSGSAWVVGAA